MKKIAVLVGSVRRESINMKLAQAMESLASARFKFVYADIGSLPHYNEDLWPDVPGSVHALKSIVEDADGVMFFVPEYNRGAPGVLKNALDWGSRPWGKSSWKRKPASLLGASPGPIATAGAQMQLRSVLLALDLIVMGQPEVYLQYRPELFDEAVVTDEKVRLFLESYLKQFDLWIERVQAKTVSIT